MNKEVQDVVDAFLIPGVNPSYHQEQLFNLKRYWPSLYDALVELAKQ